MKAWRQCGFIDGDGSDPWQRAEQYHNALRTVTVVIMDLYKHLNVPGRKCGIDIVRRGAEYSCRLRVTCEVALWLLAHEAREQNSGTAEERFCFPTQS